MNDLLLGTMWLGILVAGLSGCIVVRALGLRSTYVRDLLHVGAGIWILGWPWWHGGTVAIAIVVLAAAITMAMPWIATHNSLARRLVRSVTNGDEHWIGLVHYTLSYAALTAAGLAIDPFPAAAALLSLSLGDGVGGVAGRWFGAHFYRVGGKRKSLEGSFVVALAAMVGIVIAGALFDRPLSFAIVAALGAVAALVEALSPRGTDNLLVPAAVWLAATVVTS